MKGALVILTLATTIFVLVSGQSAMVVNVQEEQGQAPASPVVAATPAPVSPRPQPKQPQTVTTLRTPPRRRKNECTKQPPNFREINLPCGGYDREGCLKLCQKLDYPRFYCRKEEFCLCHSGDLYGC